MEKRKLVLTIIGVVILAMVIMVYIYFSKPGRDEKKNQQTINQVQTVQQKTDEKKEKITLDDLAGENLMLMRRGWSYYGDMLRDDMMKNHPEINIVDFNLYNVEAFNRCENNNEVLLAFKSWESVHPLIRIIPVEWDYTMPFGILHSKKPSIKVKRLINAINKVK